jgi:hypothetical protein
MFTYIFTLNNAGYHLIWNEINHVYLIGIDNTNFGIVFVQYSDGVSADDLSWKGVAIIRNYRQV